MNHAPLPPVETHYTDRVLYTKNPSDLLKTHLPWCKGLQTCPKYSDLKTDN